MSSSCLYVASNLCKNILGFLVLLLIFGCFNWTALWWCHDVSQWVRSWFQLCLGWESPVSVSSRNVFNSLWNFLTAWKPNEMSFFPWCYRHYRHCLLSFFISFCLPFSPFVTLLTELMLFTFSTTHPSVLCYMVSRCSSEFFFILSSTTFKCSWWFNVVISWTV